MYAGVEKGKIAMYTIFEVFSIFWF